MKISVSLLERDVELLDRLVSAGRLGSRSAGVQMALRNLADQELGDAYTAAWSEWEINEDERAWDAVSADGLEDNAQPEDFRQPNRTEGKPELPSTRKTA